MSRIRATLERMKRLGTTVSFPKLVAQMSTPETREACLPLSVSRKRVAIPEKLETFSLPAPGTIRIVGSPPADQASFTKLRRMVSDTEPADVESVGALFGYPPDWPGVVPAVP